MIKMVVSGVFHGFLFWFLLELIVEQGKEEIWMDSDALALLSGWVPGTQDLGQQAPPSPHHVPEAGVVKGRW